MWYERKNITHEEAEAENRRMFALEDRVDDEFDEKRIKNSSDSLDWSFLDEIEDLDFKKKDEQKSFNDVTDKDGRVHGYDGRFVSKSGSDEAKRASSIVHKDVMKKVESFRGKPDGTYDLESGKLKTYDDGFCVTFHQNESDESGNYKSHMGRYSEKGYDEKTNELKDKHGMEVNVGVFDNEPEISFWTKSRRKAVQLMHEYNQHSLWDCKAGKIQLNKFYDKKQNPLKGN